MKVTALVATIVNSIVSAILWLLAFLTFLFNLIGLWAPWHLAGFGTVFYTPVVVASQVLAFVFSFSVEEKKSKRIVIILNFLVLFISVFSILFTLFVSTTWFW